jgi:hypothetical protein
MPSLVSSSLSAVHIIICSALFKSSITLRRICLHTPAPASASTPFKPLLSSSTLNHAHAEERKKMIRDWLTAIGCCVCACMGVCLSESSGSMKKENVLFQSLSTTPPPIARRTSFVAHSDIYGSLSWEFGGSDFSCSTASPGQSRLARQFLHGLYLGASGFLFPITAFL